MTLHRDFVLVQGRISKSRRSQAFLLTGSTRSSKICEKKTLSPWRADRTLCWRDLEHIFILMNPQGFTLLLRSPCFKRQRATGIVECLSILAPLDLRGSTVLHIVFTLIRLYMKVQVIFLRVDPLRLELCDLSFAEGPLKTWCLKTIWFKLEQ